MELVVKADATETLARLVAAVVFLGTERHQAAGPQRVAVLYGGAVAEDALAGARLEQAESLGFRTIHLPLEDGACLHGERARRVDASGTRGHDSQLPAGPL